MADRSFRALQVLMGLFGELLDASDKRSAGLVDELDIYRRRAEAGEDLKAAVLEVLSDLRKPVVEALDAVPLPEGTGVYLPNPAPPGEYVPSGTAAAIERSITRLKLASEAYEATGTVVPQMTATVKQVTAAVKCG